MHQLLAQQLFSGHGESAWVRHKLSQAQPPGEANWEQNLLEGRILKRQAAILAIPSAQQVKPMATSALDGNIYKHGLGRGRSLQSLCCTVVLALEVPWWQWASPCETSTCPCWHLDISPWVSVVTSFPCWPAMRQALCLPWALESFSSEFSMPAAIYQQILWLSYGLDVGLSQQRSSAWEPYVLPLAFGSQRQGFKSQKRR